MGSIVLVKALVQGREIENDLAPIERADLEAKERQESHCPLRGADLNTKYKSMCK